MQLSKARVSWQCNPTSVGLRAGFIHSTAITEAKNRSKWDNIDNKYVRRCKRAEAKRTLLRDVQLFAEHLFKDGCQSWHVGKKQNGYEMSNKKAFPKGNDRRKARNNYGSQIPEWAKSFRRKKRKEENAGFFSDDSEEVEILFEASSGRGRYCFRSFHDFGDIQWRNPAWKSNERGSSSSRWRTDYEKNNSREYESPTIGSASDRMALGLAAVGPLNLDDVKNAFRMRALRWHPDRHQGPSKAIAEEKFKRCGAAYKSLCDAFATT